MRLGGFVIRSASPTLYSPLASAHASARSDTLTNKYVSGKSTAHGTYSHNS